MSYKAITEIRYNVILYYKIVFLGKGIETLLNTIMYGLIVRNLKKKNNNILL